jgi:RimJ/RimL family protein N-acetyltransferase
MDALSTLPAELPLTGIPGGALRLLGEGGWALEQQLSEVPDVPVWTLYPARMSESQARRRVRISRERAAAGSAGRYVVELDREPLGTAAIAFAGHGPEVSYALLPAGRGAGLATAAVRSLVQWAAASGHLAVTLRIVEGNLASGNIARRAGFALVDRAADPDGTLVTVWAAAVSAPPEAAGGRA